MTIIPAIKIAVIEGESNVSPVDNFDTTSTLAEWNATTDYSTVDAEAIVLEYNGIAVNSVYKSNGKETLEDGTVVPNVGNHPTESALWRIDRKTNLHKCTVMQEFGETKADIGQTNLVIVFTFKEAKRLILKKINGASVLIEQIDANGVVFKTSGIVSLIEKPRNSRELLLFKKEQTPTFATDLEFLREQKVRVTIEGADASLGLFFVGTPFYVGWTECGVSTQDSILRDEGMDEWGQYSLSPKNFVQEVKVEASTLSVNFTKTMREMNKMLNVPCLFVPITEEDYMSIFGIYIDKGGKYEADGYAYISLDVKSFSYENEKNENWQ